MFKKVFLTMLAVALALCFASVVAFASEDESQPVAKMNGVEYYDLQEALDVAATTTAKDVITMLSDYETDDIIVIDSHIEIVGGGYTVTGNGAKTFEVKHNTIITNLNIVNTAVNGRCVDTRKSLTLKLQTGTTLTALNGCTQPLTIGGYDTKATTVTLTGVTIDAGNGGYGIIAFVPTNLTIDKYSEVSGYAALYMKEGTSGSFVNIRVGSVLTGTNSFDGPSDNFGTIVYEDGGITTQLLRSAKVVANGNGEAMQSVFCFNTDSEELNEVIFYNYSKGKSATAEANGNAALISGSNLENVTFELQTTASQQLFADAGYTVEDGYAIVEPVASVGGLQFAKFDDALDYVEAGQTIKLLADVTMDEVIVREGIILDINGNALNANVVAYGSVIDSTDGEGIVVGELAVQYHENEKYVPLMDSEAGGYRLFKSYMRKRGTLTPEDGVVRFAYTLDFTKAEAYELWAENYGDVTLSMEWTAKDSEGTYVYTEDIISGYTAAAAEQVKVGKVKAYLALDFSGVVSEEVLTATPVLTTSTGVVINYGTKTYTCK